MRNIAIAIMAGITAQEMNRIRVWSHAWRDEELIRIFARVGN